MQRLRDFIYDRIERYIYNPIQIRNRLTTPIAINKIQSTYYPNKPLELAIERSLLSSRAGVHVLYTPAGYGKTTSARRVIHRLQVQGKIAGVLDASFLNNDNSKSISNLDDEFNFKTYASQILKVDDKKMFSLAQMLNIDSSKPVVILVDNFDEISKIVPDKIRDVLLVGLAEESQLTKSFTVLLITNKRSTEQAILKLNGGQKFYKCLVLNSRF